MTGNSPRSQSPPPTPPLSPTAATSSTSQSAQSSQPSAIPPIITITGYDPTTPGKLRGPPPEDFALQAFQTPDKLKKLVRALAEHDVREAFRSKGMIDYTTWVASEMGASVIGEYDLTGPPEAKRHLRQGTDESNITVRPPLVKVNEDDYASASETERDEPKKEEGSSVKKSKKKKKPKKKKGKGVAREAEEEEGKDREEEKEEEEVDHILSGVTLGRSVSGGEEPAEVTVDLGVSTRSVDPDTTLVDPDTTLVDAGTGSPSDMADESRGTSVTSGISIIVTPDSPAIPLPAVEAEEAAPISPILSASRAGSLKADEEGGHEHEVAVRLPNQQITHTVTTIASHDDEDKENRPPPVPVNTHMRTHSWSVGLSPMAVPPLTPPHSPPTQPPHTVDSIVHSEKLILFADQPDTPPQVVTDLQDPVIASAFPEAMPLANSWTLYHSNTGIPPTNQASKFGTTGTAGVLSAATRNKAAEEYSHGLFRLFNADNVFDLLGTWKALRRKVAHKYGRAIEPEDSPIAPDMAGLGIVLLPDDTNFHFFLASVKPMWEDPMCLHGGKIMLSGTGLAVSARQTA